VLTRGSIALEFMGKARSRCAGIGNARGEARRSWAFSAEGAPSRPFGVSREMVTKGGSGVIIMLH